MPLHPEYLQTRCVIRGHFTSSQWLLEMKFRSNQGISMVCSGVNPLAQSLNPHLPICQEFLLFQSLTLKAHKSQPLKE